jgi:hypothetical protein
MADRCKATSKSTGKRCRQPVVAGKKVCRYHGGLSLAGRESPSFKHGRYSKYLPDRLAAKYEEALSDQELISLANEIALVDSQLTTQMELLRETGMNRNGWSTARELYQSFRVQTSAGNHGRAINDLEALGALLEEENENILAWRIIGELVEQRRRLIETERKRLSDEDHAVAIDKLMVFMAALLDIIRRRVGDEDVQRQIAQDVRAMLASNVGTREFEA